MELSIVIPAFDERDKIALDVTSAADFLAANSLTGQIIIVDDGSTDETWIHIERLKETVPQLRGIKFRRNYGQTSAMVVGFEKVEEIDDLAARVRKVRLAKSPEKSLVYCQARVA